MADWIEVGLGACGECRGSCVGGVTYYTDFTCVVLVLCKAWVAWEAYGVHCEGCREVVDGVNGGSEIFFGRDVFQPSTMDW